MAKSQSRFLRLATTLLLLLADDPIARSCLFPPHVRPPNNLP
jgi:hypothetical protein